jgi:uncharacterized membrane protein YccC
MIALHLEGVAEFRLAALPSRLSPAAGWLAGRRGEMRFAVRVAVAGAASFALAEALGLAQGYWAVFTSVIVTQASVGGSLKATVDRLTGTLGGAAAGAIVALVVAHQAPEVRIAGLAIALLPVAFVAAIDPRFRVAPVTAVIVLISPTGSSVNPLFFTIDRVAEIALGSIVALAISLVVFPARAHSVLNEATSRLLGLYAEYLALLIGNLSAPADPAAQRRLQVATRRRLNAMDAMVEEARRERAIRLTGNPDPSPILRSSQRLRADLILLARAGMTPLPPTLLPRLAPHLAAIAETAGTQLRALGAAFATRTIPPAPAELDTALRAWRAEIASLRAERALSGLSGEDVGRVFALGFALDQFRENIGDLGDRASEFARARPA